MLVLGLMALALGAAAHDPRRRPGGEDHHHHAHQHHPPKYGDTRANIPPPPPPPFEFKRPQPFMGRLSVGQLSAESDPESAKLLRAVRELAERGIKAHAQGLRPRIAPVSKAARDKFLISGLFPDAQLVVSDELRDSLGQSHFRLQQWYKGRRVRDGTVLYRRFPDGDVSLSGVVFTGIDLSLGPPPAKEDLPVIVAPLRTAWLQRRENRGMVLDPSMELLEWIVFVSPMGGDIGAKAYQASELMEAQFYAERRSMSSVQTTRPYLLWAPSPDGGFRPPILELETLLSPPLVRARIFRNRRRRRRRHRFALKFSDAQTRQTPDGRCVYENARVRLFKEYGMRASEDAAFSVRCGREQSEPLNDAVQPMEQLLDNAQLVFGFFESRYGNPVKVATSDVVPIRLRPERRVGGQFNGRDVTIFGGDDNFRPAVTAPGLAVEVGKAVTAAESGLSAGGESGAVAVAFADLASMAVQAAAEGESATGWGVGAELAKRPGNAIRWLDSPSRDGAGGIEGLVEYEDGMDVVRASGLVSKVYFYMTQGSWPMREAYDVFYIANRFYWTSSSGFRSAAAGTLSAACELLRGHFLPFDYGGQKLEDAVAAWAKVGFQCRKAEGCAFACENMPLRFFDVDKLTSSGSPFDAWLVANIVSLESEALVSENEVAEALQADAIKSLQKLPLARGMGDIFIHSETEVVDALKTYLKGIKLVQRGNMTVDSLGNIHTRFQQYYGGLRILNAHMVYQKFTGGSYMFLDENNDTRVVENIADVQLSGKFIGGISPLVVPDVASIDMEKLRQDILRLLRDRNFGGSVPGWDFDPRRQKIEFVLRPVEGDLEGRPLRLCVEADFFGYGPAKSQPMRPYLLAEMRADGGLEVLELYDALSTFAKWYIYAPAGNEKIGRKEVVLTLEKDPDSGDCWYQTDLVRTIKLSGRSASRDENATLHVPCAQIAEAEPINGAFGPANDAHFYADKVMQFLAARYRENPFGERLRVEVQGAPEDNAHWDGEELVLYNGARLFHPTVNAGIVAHEIAHGVTEVTSNLAYAEQSGAINEAYSDMLAKTAEIVILGKDKNDYTIGGDTTKGKPLRFMDSPEKDGRSISHVRDFKDGMDVHFSSGIFNKVFADLASSPTFSALEAFDCFHIANKYYWGRSTTFNKAAEGTLRAACSLHRGLYVCEVDHSNINLADVIAAFRGVGIDCNRDDAFTDDCLYTCSGAPETQRNPIEDPTMERARSFAGGLTEGGPG